LLSQKCAYAILEHLARGARLAARPRCLHEGLG
jgi:hypothetical protein